MHDHTYIEVGNKRMQRFKKYNVKKEQEVGYIENNILKRFDKHIYYCS